MKLVALTLISLLACPFAAHAKSHRRPVDRTSRDEVTAYNRRMLSRLTTLGPGDASNYTISTYKNGSAHPSVYVDCCCGR